MATEIERKFLVCSDAWRRKIEHSERYVQGYLANTTLSSIRVRMSDERAWLNIKRAIPGVERAEYDYSIPVSDARELLADLCEGYRIEKTRHRVRYAGRLWEIDVFEGANEGLTIAEVELDLAEQTFQKPAWLGDEISHDLRYYNNMLAIRPYKHWS
ncbi:MAG: CYTH domain-containing protein [Pseudomonadota bacterium]|nr:CYTH domain-containing protein [Pseudomonadota bacterium]